MECLIILIQLYCDLDEMFAELKETKKTGKKVIGQTPKMIPTVAISDEYMDYQEIINTEETQQEESKQRKGNNRTKKKTSKKLKFESDELELEEPQMNVQAED